MGEKLSVEQMGAGNALVLPERVRERSLYRDIAVISIPAILELFLNQAASMVDQMMVGQLGTWALSAVGLTLQPKFLMVYMVMAINVGTTAMVSRFRGKGDREGANRALRQAMLLTLIMSILCCVVMFTFARPVVVFMGGQSEQIIEAATVYLRIQAVGFIAQGLTATITAVLRGIGNSRTAMLYNTVSNVVNVVLNWGLIYGRLGLPRMEVAGASIATVIGQVVALVIALAVITRPGRYLQLTLKDFQLDREIIGEIVRIGLPVMIERVIFRVGAVAYTKMVAGLGETLYASHLTCVSIMQMTYVVVEGTQVSVTTLVGQSIGKRRMDMIRLYISRCRRWSMAAAVLIAGALCLWGGPLVGLYLDSTEPNRAAVIAAAIPVLWLLAALQPVQFLEFIYVGVLRSAGDTKYTAYVYTLVVLLLRPPLTALLLYVMHWGLLGAWVAMGVDQVLRMALMYRRYRTGNWVKALEARGKG